MCVCAFMYVLYGSLFFIYYLNHTRMHLLQITEPTASIFFSLEYTL